MTINYCVDQAAERVMDFKRKTLTQNPLAAQAAKKFDSSKSNVIGLIGKDNISRGQ